MAIKSETGLLGVSHTLLKQNHLIQMNNLCKKAHMWVKRIAKSGVRYLETAEQCLALDLSQHDVLAEPPQRVDGVQPHGFELVVEHVDEVILAQQRQTLGARRQLAHAVDRRVTHLYKQVNNSLTDYYKTKIEIIKT